MTHRAGKSERRAPADEGAPETEDAPEGGGVSLPVLLAAAAIFGLIVGGGAVVLSFARRAGAPAPAPATAPAPAADGRTEEERLRARAEAGDARAMLELGRGLFQGAWGRRDEAAAERWLGVAVNSADPEVAAEATEALEELRRFVRVRRFEREAETAGD